MAKPTPVSGLPLLELLGMHVTIHPMLSTKQGSTSDEISHNSQQQPPELHIQASMSNDNDGPSKGGRFDM